MSIRDEHNVDGDTTTEYSSMRSDSLDTRCVHAGRADFARLGVHAPPIDLSSTYPLHDLAEGTADLDALAAGAREPRYGSVYARLHNPTVARLEQAFAELEEAETAVAFSSGMAAVTAMLLSVTAHGRHVVAVRPVYGGTDHLLTSGLLALDVTWAHADQVQAALRPDTALVFLETPANPTCALVDIASVVAQAGHVPVVVDSTFATPVLQRPLALGAAASLHSATKFLGGHGDTVGGIIATSEALARPLRQVRIVTGALLHPLAAFMLQRGIPTLALRVLAAQERAQALALRLAAHPAVSAVHYPGLPGGDPQRLIGRQMDGPGSVLAFEVAGGYEQALRVMRGVRLITPAVSLGSTDSLIQHPAGLTHRLVPEPERAALGISPGMLRLSVGVEGVEDLWRDLDRALSSTAESDHEEGEGADPEFATAEMSGAG